MFNNKMKILDEGFHDDLERLDITLEPGLVLHTRNGYTSGAKAPCHFNITVLKLQLRAWNYRLL